MNNCNFKVGQTVWCLIYGEGKVVQIKSRGAYHITVEFNNVDEQYYTHEGKYHVDGNRTLFFSEPKIEAQEFPSKYTGKTVLFRNKCSRVAYGPSLVIHEYPNCIVVDSGDVHFSDYDVFIVEQAQE